MSDLLDFDPKKLTVAQLKSKLTEHGVDLPMKKENKPFYVEMFENLQEKKRKESKKRAKEHFDSTLKKKGRVN